MSCNQPPVVRQSTLRTGLRLAARYSLELASMDVDAVCWNAPVDEELFVELPLECLHNGRRAHHTTSAKESFRQSSMLEAKWSSGTIASTSSSSALVCNHQHRILACMSDMVKGGERLCHWWQSTYCRSRHCWSPGTCRKCMHQIGKRFRMKDVCLVCLEWRCVTIDPLER